MAEAMFLGVPVVATNYSANTEYCTTENSMPVPYTLVPVPTSYRTGPMTAVEKWAEPDINAAAKALQLLHNDIALRQRLSENGKRFIADHFSTENFKKSVEKFLTE